MFLKEETHFLRTNLIPPEEIDNFQNPHANAAFPHASEPVSEILKLLIARGNGIFLSDKRD